MHEQLKTGLYVAGAVASVAGVVLFIHSRKAAAPTTQLLGQSGVGSDSGGGAGSIDVPSLDLSGGDKTGTGGSIGAAYNPASGSVITRNDGYDATGPAAMAALYAALASQHPAMAAPAPVTPPATSGPAPTISSVSPAFTPLSQSLGTRGPDALPPAVAPTIPFATNTSAARAAYAQANPAPDPSTTVATVSPLAIARATGLPLLGNPMRGGATGPIAPAPIGSFVAPVAEAPPARKRFGT